MKLGKYTVPTGNRTPGCRVAVHYTTPAPRKLHTTWKTDTLTTKPTRPGLTYTLGDIIFVRSTFCSLFCGGRQNVYRRLIMNSRSVFWFLSMYSWKGDTISFTTFRIRYNKVQFCWYVYIVDILELWSTFCMSFSSRMILLVISWRPHHHTFPPHHHCFYVYRNLLDRWTDVVHWMSRCKILPERHRGDSDWLHGWDVFDRKSGCVYELPSRVPVSG